jgi:hypothetical protein
MGARQWIEKNKQVSGIVSFVLVVAAIAFAYYQFRPERPPTKSWFTTDDGQTWFRDSNRKVPPFQHDGKEAVFAMVYECHGKQYVGYMSRYKPEAKRKLDEYYAAEDAGKTTDPSTPGSAEWHVEFKRPGEKEWKSGMENRTLIRDVKCPHGSKEDPLIVYP